MTTKSKIIEGLTFEISQPYTAGHVLTEAEAKTLNQTRSENIGNNLRQAIKDAIAKRDSGDATDFDSLSQTVADYDRDYTFSMGGGGASTRKLDPIEREARAVAREYIKARLAEKGRKITVAPEGMTKDEWNEKVEGQIESLITQDAVLKLAKKRVAQKQQSVDAALGELEL